MKAILISDVHSNLYALQAIFAQEGSYDAAYCAGDLTDYGPQPGAVIGFCREHGVISVMGNHDEGLLRLTDAACRDALAAGDGAWRHDNWLSLGEEERAYLRALPAQVQFDLDGIHYQMQHSLGDGYRTIDGIAQFNGFWQGVNDGLPRRMIFGHTHRQGVYLVSQRDGWLNPGSASYRRDDDLDKRAHYMVIDNGEIFFRTAVYDRTPLLRQLVSRHRSGQYRYWELQVGYFFFGDEKRQAGDPIPDLPKE